MNPTVNPTVNDTPSQKLSDVERIKTRSNYLRGSLIESLRAPLTGALADEDTQLSKFHGIYQQDDRDVRAKRKRALLEPLYSFMVRVRVPGGVCTPVQWLSLDDLADRHANGTLRLTTRQAVQFHGIDKRQLKQSIADINATLLDTIAACGDVNRNVMCTVNPQSSAAHAQVFDWTRKISDHLTPASNAYHEIWLDGKKAHSSEEPIYGPTYLPRKFKTALVIPPSNDVDVFAHDLGFIAIIEDEQLLGFNVTVGGGMGMTHGEPGTYPRLADVIGFAGLDQVLEVAEHVVGVQRDFGNRADRKNARLKYTIDRMGLASFVQELHARLGYTLAPAREFVLTSTGDAFGWTPREDGKWNYNLFIENGRVADTPAMQLRTALREVAQFHTGEFRLTPNQNLSIAGVDAEARERVVEVLRARQVLGPPAPSRLRSASIACVAFPTCSQAMAEAERYMPDFISRLELLMRRHGIEDQPIITRMTGCPNGCARPYLGEIGLVGKGPGRYNLYLGASPDGRRLNTLYRENVNQAQILAALDGVLARYAVEGQPNEAFGDFVVRAGIVLAVRSGQEFHARARLPSAKSADASPARNQPAHDKEAQV